MRAILLVASLVLSGLASAEQCPADFDEFMRAFESSPEFQVEHWKKPLKYQYLEANPDSAPKKVEFKLTKENVGQFGAPPFPSSAERQQASLEQTVTAPDDKTRVVRLAQQYSDSDIKYFFKRTRACWELVRVEDSIL